MQDKMEFRKRVLEILTQLDGKFRVSAAEPESFTVLIQSIEAIRRSLAGLVMESRPAKPILAELGRLVSALLTVERSAQTLQTWLGREADDGACGMSPMAGLQYREAVVDYLKQLCTFKEALEGDQA